MQIHLPYLVVKLHRPSRLVKSFLRPLHTFIYCIAINFDRSLELGIGCRVFLLITPTFTQTVNDKQSPEVRREENIYNSTHSATTIQIMRIALSDLNIFNINKLKFNQQMETVFVCLCYCNATIFDFAKMLRRTRRCVFVRIGCVYSFANMTHILKTH